MSEFDFDDVPRRRPAMNPDAVLIMFFLGAYGAFMFLVGLLAGWFL